MLCSKNNSTFPEREHRCHTSAQRRGISHLHAQGYCEVFRSLINSKSVRVLTVQTYSCSSVEMEYQR